MNSTAKSNPPVDEPVIVVYDQFECLGYIDDQGIWRDWFTNRELKNVADWTPLD